MQRIYIYIYILDPYNLENTTFSVEGWIFVFVGCAIGMHTLPFGRHDLRGWSAKFANFEGTIVVV